jgi:hypothetical protein
MQCKSIAFGLCICVAGFMSCSPQYGVAKQSSFVKYLEKPIYKDSIESAIYIGGQYHFGDKGYQLNENSHFADFSVHRSHTHKNLNYSYGLLGYSGKYNAKIEGHEGNKEFYGFGALADVNFKFSTEKFEFRIVGLRASIIHELGEFSNYRESMSELGLAYNRNIDNTPIYIGLNSNVVYKFNSDFNLGYYAGAGRTFDKGENGTGSIIFTYLVHANYKRFTGLVQYNLTVGNSFSILSFGLQYKLF